METTQHDVDNQRTIVNETASGMSKSEVVKSEVEKAHSTPSDSNQLSDRDVIFNASARLALYGITIGLSSDVIGSKPPKQLLSERVSTRCEKESCGSTIAASLEISGWGTHLDASDSNKDTHDSQSASQEKSTTVLHITRWLVPTKSFRIAESNVILSSEAIEAIKMIHNKDQAKRFMLDYGSHVPCGDQHLGGIVWTTERTTSSEAAQARTSEDTHNSETSLSGDAGNARASANYDKNQSSTNSAGDKLSESTSSKDVTIEFAGPQAKDFDNFVNRVTNSSESWYLLDRGPAEAMVPVWSFVTVKLFGEDIATRLAPLLQTVWSEEAIRFNDIDIIKGLIDRASHMAESSVRAAIRSQLNGLSALNLDTTPERKLDASVKKLLTMIDEYERDFGISILADLLRDHQLPRVLGHFAQSENPRFKSALKTLGEYFDPHRLLKLQLEIPSITLDDHVRCKLDAAAGRKPRESNASDGWRPTPAQLREIPSSINEIVDGVSSLDAGGEKLLTQRLGEIPPSINAIAHSVSSLDADGEKLLTQRLGEFWAVTMAELHKRSMKDNDRDILHRIEDLASKLQWSSNEERFTRTLNERQVHLFAHVIESILAPKTSSATVKSAKEDPVWRSTFFVDVDTGGKKSISHVQTNRVISSASSVLDTILDTLVHRLDVRGALYPNVVVNH
ncbi:unnamed protein product [Aphanomyces euteiches]